MTLNASQHQKQLNIYKHRKKEQKGIKRTYFLRRWDSKLRVTQDNNKTLICQSPCRSKRVISTFQCLNVLLSRVEQIEMSQK